MLSIWLLVTMTPRPDNPADKQAPGPGAHRRAGRMFTDMSPAKTKTNRFVALAIALALIGLGLSTISGAFDANDPRRGYGYIGPGPNEWTGSYSLYTGANQTGEHILGYCLEDGDNHPHGTSSANSGFTLQSDYLGARGASLAERQALSYILWKYGDTTDPTRAGDVHKAVGHLSHDPTYNDGLPPDWIINEGMANRGPWTVGVNLVPEGERVRVNVSVNGPGGPINGLVLLVDATNLTNLTAPSGSLGPYVQTNPQGQATFLADPVDPSQNSAIIAYTGNGPGYYRIFWGLPTTEGRATQRVVTRTVSEVVGGGTFTAPDVDPPEEPEDPEEPPEVFAEAYIRKVTTNPAYQSGAGAVFRVHEGTSTSGQVAATLTVGPNGRTNIATIPSGIYHVVEVSAPPGQTINFAPQTINVGEGEEVEISAENGVVEEGELRLIKLDADTGEPLAGAQFRVSYDTDDDGTFETPIGDFTSAVDPVVISGLRAGRYQVEEISPPPGYALAETDQRIQVANITYGNPNTTADDQLVVTITVSDSRSGVTSQVVDASGTALNAVTLNEDGTSPPLFDQVQVTAIPADISGTITTTLYGPQPTSDLASFECSPATEVVTRTFDATGSGPHTSPEFVLPGPGLYTFVSTWVGEDGSSATHPCGLASETVSAPGITTQVSERNTSFGGSIYDTAELVGVLDGTPGEIAVALYGPFRSIEDIECSPASEVWMSTITTSGGGTYVSEEFTPDSAGIFTFVETWTSDDGSASATHRCGEITETTVMNPTITTEVSEQVVGAGSTVFDTAFLAGVPDGFDGQVTFDLFGPFPAGTDLTCGPGSLHESVTVNTSGGGTVESPTIAVNEAGIYTFVATWTSDSGELSATHDCGIAEETVTVNAPVIPPATPDDPEAPAPPTDTTSGGGSGGSDGFSGGGESTGALPRTGSESARVLAIGILAVVAGLALLIPALGIAPAPAVARQRR